MDGLIRIFKSSIIFNLHFRYNTSLPMDRCPKKEIEELRRMIISDERGSSTGALRENVDNIFDLKELKVMSIRLIPLGLCAEQATKQSKNVLIFSAPNPSNSKAGSATDNSYLITFIIPAVVIVCMILLAGIIASVLYRRRMTGKIPHLNRRRYFLCVGRRRGQVRIGVR